MKILTVVLFLSIPVQQSYDSTPAYHDFQELLKTNDLSVKNGTYACFYDAPERSHFFFVINGMLMGEKNDVLMVSVSSFKDGVSDEHVQLFSGKLKSLSGKMGSPKKCCCSWETIFGDENLARV